MDTQTIALTTTLLAGVLASATTEALNRFTPRTKFDPKVLRATAFTAAAGIVVGLQLRTGQPVDWNNVVLMTAAAWGISLGTHDVLSPRTK